MAREIPPTFEVGVVYRKNSRYYLAVRENTLLSLKNGVRSEIQPYNRYEAARGVTVADLCRRWKISAEDLDSCVRDYLAPCAEGIKPDPRDRAGALERDRSHRVVRLLRRAG